jgi:hypothetical protein
MYISLEASTPTTMRTTNQYQTVTAKRILIAFSWTSGLKELLANEENETVRHQSAILHSSNEFNMFSPTKQ